MKQAELIGRALYNSNGPVFLDRLLNRAVERRKLAQEGSSSDPMLEEQRKQDMHDQQLQFADDKHQLELARMQMELEHQQQNFDLQQLQSIQKQQEASEAAAAQETQKQQMAQQQGTQGLLHSNIQMQHKLRQNVLDARQKEQMKQGSTTTVTERPLEQALFRVMPQEKRYAEPVTNPVPLPDATKTSAHIDAYGNVVNDPSPLLPTLAGGTLGGAAAHYMFPTELAKHYRSMIKPPISIEAGAVKPLEASELAANEILKSKALSANARRLLKGVGGGLLAGYLLHRAFTD